ncbi:MAG TPA: VOC family protein [Gaiellaceae bacterium]|nr:VOC family protein [Gaiellaceae bacterium]
MFDNVTMRARDLEASRRFYALAAAPAALVLEAADEPTQRLHIAFAVPGRAAVDAWWRALVDAGYTSDGEPGPRQYNETYYGAFVLDPDGNSVEAVHHAGSGPSGIDHLWLRTSDLSAARALFADVRGVAVRRETPERLTFGFDDRVGSFSFVPGEPATRNVRLGAVWV